MAYKLLPVVSVGVIALGKLYFHRVLLYTLLRAGARVCPKLRLSRDISFHFSRGFLIRLGIRVGSETDIYGLLVFNTLCLRNVDASFFQIARGLLLPCTILINALATRITPRSNVIRAAALVTVGFFLGISPGSFFKSSDIASSGEVIGSSTPSVSILESTKYMWKDVAQNMDRDKALALVYGTLSAFMTAVHAVLVKSAVKTLEGSVLRLTYWSNMMSGIFLVRYFSFAG